MAEGSESERVSAPRRPAVAADGRAAEHRAHRGNEAEEYRPRVARRRRRRRRPRRRRGNNMLPVVGCALNVVEVPADAPLQVLANRVLDRV